ncbi:BREX-2 system adenine-specific DNA-methyltransferase PglX [Streptomyces sp. NPDC054933]
MSERGVDQRELLKDLRKQVMALEEDLRERSEAVAEYQAQLESEYAQARDAKRTAATYGAWRDERITQVAVAWVLACVFVRFCEDNRLIADPFLAGRGERLKDAEDRHAEFFRRNPEKNDCDWLIHAFESLAATNSAVAGLFDRAHNPLWQLAPSYEAASALLKFWRRPGPDGEIVHDFTDKPVVGSDGVVEYDGLSTRFLGDLYQDLSEHARKTYALLQTPEFVEEFILDLTLEPAVREFGLAPETKIGWDDRTVTGLRTIDPACGSGHFLLGTFKRLLAKWRAAEPGTNIGDLTRRTLESVHGCDKNPFAVSISRFRLLIAALQAVGVKQLNRAPSFPINIAIGDSLLHGRGGAGVQEDLFAIGKIFAYRTEDVARFVQRCDLLGTGSYHVVIGNPPYISVNDDQERENYRKAYGSCRGEYFLTVPFAERFFRLAVRSPTPNGVSGLVGQITGNSFMKQKFGRPLVETFLPGVDLSLIIDLSGIQIPGHPTPTVILVGRNRNPSQATPVRVTYRLRDDPKRVDDPMQGVVWPEVKENFGNPGFSSEWIGVGDFSRERLARHPWILSGGDVASLRETLEKSSRITLKSLVMRCGFFGDTHADAAFTLPSRESTVRRSQHLHARYSYRGEHIRDWHPKAADLVAFPYDENGNPLGSTMINAEFSRHFWPLRSALWARTAFGGKSYLASGREWWEWHQLPKDRGAHQWTICHAEVSTHNHFVLDRDGKMLNRSAPITKLPENASEEDHFAILGLLNSSTACFWFRQVNQPKSGGGVGRGVQDEAWEERYGFRSGNVKSLPVPAILPHELGSTLDGLSRELSKEEPSAICNSGILPTRVRLDAARAKNVSIRNRMIAMQEELDWQVYGSYGLLSPTEVNQLTASDQRSVPEVQLGERAFEIVLARKVAAGEVETSWFRRHGSVPTTVIPSRWPEWYRVLVQARITLIEKRNNVALVERPECKRRWSSSTWEKKEREALQEWLRVRCEDRRLWYYLRDGFEQPRSLTISQLADRLVDHDSEVSYVTALYAAAHLGRRESSVEEVLWDVLSSEHVPYLAAYRYTESGLRKRGEWEQIWEKQREEDRACQFLGIAVPTRYAAKDFMESSYWANRDELDISRERFISYPDANPDADSTLLLGWAGWDHRDQAQALVNLVKDRVSQLSWGDARITPLLAGLAELMPWVRQWFGTEDDDWGGNAAEEFGAFLDAERTKRGITADQLAAWRPTPKARGRKTGSTAALRTAKKTDTSDAATPTA